MKPFRDKSAPAPRHPRRRLGANGPAPNGPAWGVVIALALAGCSSAKIGGGTTGGDTGGTPGGPGSGAVGGSGGGSGTASNQPGSTGGNGASGSGGVVGVTPPNPTTSAAGTAAACDGLTSRRVRRLSIREYATVVYDLLGAAAQTATLAALPPEPSVAGFDNQDIALLVSEPFMENISDLAAKLSQAADPTTLAPCATAAGSNACLATFINTFASKAYGRPLTAAEVTAAQAVAATGQDYPTAVRLVIELALQSPSMLYVSELGPVNSVASAQPVLLTPYEIASQLSFLLSGSRPDATLLQVAQTSGFQNVSDIQTQAQRLVPTARGQAALTRFINGWMDQGPMTDISKSAMIYPEYTPALAAAMQQEYDTFVSTQLAGGMGTMASFFTGVSANPPAALAPIYGADLTATGLNPAHRKGILTLPALLSYNSSDVSSGPIQRGLLVRRQLLCQNVPPPPANVLQQVALMPVDTTATDQTTRQKFEAHVTMASCASCHNSFDPIGFGLEDMDGLGRFRTTENGQTVDSSGALTGTDVDGAFEGPAALSAKLAQSQQATTCMVQHFFNFAQARDPLATDMCVIQDWSTKLQQSGGHIVDLINAYVAHQNFVYRRDDR